MRIASFLRREGLGLGLVAIAIIAQAIALAPEWTVTRVPPNDAVFHLAAAERLGESLGVEPFLDPWVDEWSLGYPVWRSYQPVPHLAAALVLRVFATTPPDLAFARLQYLLLILLPVSLYTGARLIGLEPLGAGLAACFAALPSTAGDMGRYGLSYGSTVWRGSGLYTQLFALHLLVPTLGLTRRALDREAKLPLASLGLALTALSHVVFGYVAFLSTLVFAWFGDPEQRSRRLARLPSLIVPALLLLAWFVVPLLATRIDTNRSRWEAGYKWDSFGAPVIVKAIIDGELFDAGRPPLLTVVAGLGVIAAVVAGGSAARRMGALTLLWLLLFFGRDTFGHLLRPLGVPGELHLHRLQIVFEWTVLTLAAHGIGLSFGRLRRGAKILAAVSLVLAVWPLWRERIQYLDANAAWATASLAEHERERSDIEAAIASTRTLLAQRPGRVAAGKAASWGKDFKIGSATIYSYLTRAHLDQVSFLYHSMSRTSEIMVLRDEERAGHDVLMGIRAVIAPTGRSMPPHFRQHSRNGRFTVWESSREGYIGLVDVIAKTDGGRAQEYFQSAAWLNSPLVESGQVISLEPALTPELPELKTGAPPPTPTVTSARGQILRETREPSTLRADLNLERKCWALVKLTWHPDLRATVDGREVAMLRVTPGFGAVAVEAGRHQLEIRFAPPATKAVLFAAGVLLFGLWSLPLAVPLHQQTTSLLTRTLGNIGRWFTPRRRTALALLIATIIAVRPLFRGQLIVGHDALEYPPRVVEFESRLSRFELPFWAPDLGNGFGQPLFGFAPPLVYVAALPFRGLGLGLADSLQFGLAFLHLVGAAAIYRIARRFPGAPLRSRGAALVGTLLWLFAPYLALDLIVRTAWAEAAAVAVAPLALASLIALLRAPSLPRMVAAGAAIALIPLGHNAAALLVLPALGLVTIASSGREWKRVVWGTGAVALALLLSAWFWVPALFEKSFVKVELLREGFLHYSEHWVEWSQLLWSRWGYGLSGPGAGDGMSFAVGIPLLSLAIAGLVQGWRHRHATPLRLQLTLAAIAGFATWLATSASAPLWDRIGSIQYLAYPWRALCLPALCLPLVALPMIEWLEERRTLAVVAAWIMLAGLPRTEPQRYSEISDDSFSPAIIAERGINTTTREEYEPRWVSQRPPFRSERLRPIGGSLEMIAEGERGAHQRHRVRLRDHTLIEASTFYYPGFTIRIDGKATAIEKAEVSGLMRFTVPPGEHDITIDLEPTATRAGARSVSVIAMIISLLLLASGAFRHRLGAG